MSMPKTINGEVWGLNREKLAKAIFKNEYPSHDWGTIGPGINTVKERCRIDADAIIAKEAELWEKKL